MALARLKYAAEARTALHAITSDPSYGAAALSSAPIMANLLRDYLPDAPRETGLLIAAATAGVSAQLSDHVAQGLDARTAVSLAASSLETASAFTPEACEWVAAELAIALGLPGSDLLNVAAVGDEPEAAQTVPQAGLAQAGSAPGPERPVPGRPEPGGQPTGLPPPTELAANAARAGPARVPAAQRLPGPISPHAAALAFGGHGSGPVTGAPPPMPVPRAGERTQNAPFMLTDGGRYTIGWRFWPAQSGGPSFVTLHRNALGSLRVVERYPLTEEGWAAAWRALLSLEPATARRVLRALAERAGADNSQVRKELDGQSLASLPEAVLLLGYVQGTNLPTGESYDLRFFRDHLAIYPRNGLDVLAMVPAGEIAAIDVIDPRVPFGGYGYGSDSSVDRGVLAAALRSPAARGRTSAMVRVRAGTSDLVFAISRSEPGPLRTELGIALRSPGLGGPASPAPGSRAPAQAHVQGPQAAAQARGAAPAAPASPVDELARLASLLDNGLLTREEFEHLKARLIQGQ